MLWLALRFPELPLEVFTRGTRSAGSLAVSSGADVHAEIVAHNHAAKKRGIRNGMPLAAAFALDSALHVVTRDAAAERAALERIAAWGIQFTPVVSLAPPAEVLLEISGSLGLFGGLNSLLARVSRGICELGYTATIACAPTPLAAQLFARAGLAVRIHHADALRLSLEQLPVDVLESASQQLMDNIGVRTIEDILRLPRDGLARRCGQALLDDLDRALGKLPDPRAPFAPPQNYTASLPLPAPVEHVQALLFAAHRLLGELCGLLAATGNGVQRLDFRFAHEAFAPTCTSISLVAASRDPDHLTNVLRERLARLELPAPATEITLISECFTPLPAHNLSFLPDARDDAETAAQLIERLSARLGEKAVRGLDLVADHRPEYAWRHRKPESTCNILFLKDNLNRPLWLLDRPQPLGEGAPHYDGPLNLLVGPEYIETGWWDGSIVAREYFVARNPQDALLWIYKERFTSGGWHLHGFFA